MTNHTTTKNHQFSGQPVSSLRSSRVKWEINPSKTSMMIMRIHYAFLVDEILHKNKRSGDSKHHSIHNVECLSSRNVSFSIRLIVFRRFIFPLSCPHTRVIILLKKIVLYFVWLLDQKMHLNFLSNYVALESALRFSDP